MLLEIDEYKMDKTNLSAPEILALKLLNDSSECNFSMSDLLESLQKEGYIAGFANDNITFMSITNTGRMIVNRITSEQTQGEKVSEDNERLTRLAEDMRELYPKGSKRDDYGNPAYPWRDSVSAIRDRLRKFELNYYDGKKLDHDEAVEVTKRYIESCKRVDPVLLRTMRTLPYFIYKDGESTFRKWLDAGLEDELPDESNGMTIL